MTVEVTGSDKTLTRREREKLSHRREIMDAAMHIFSQKGFFNATLDEIAQKAEFSKGAIYLYFSNKEDLLFSIIKEKDVKISEFVKKTLAGESSFREELRALFNWNAEMAIKDKDFVTTLMAQHACGFKALSEEKAAELCASHKEWDKIVITRISQAIEDGELRNIPPEAVYGLIHGAVENMIITRWDCETVEQLQEHVDLFLDMIFNGIAKEKEAVSER